MLNKWKQYTILKYCKKNIFIKILYPVQRQSEKVKHEFRVTCYEFKYTSYKLKSASSEFRSTS